ncbi:MAG: APC family permease [Candidatus Dependentiae bacterium]|jgi:amino acid efflux transporter
MSAEQTAPTQKKISVLAATVIGVNAMIGAGIFAMPTELSATVGPASILSYLLSSLLILSIVFPLSRLAQLHPGEGWGYRYPALWGGHNLGMLSSLGYVSGVIVAMGFLAQQGGVQLGQWLPYAPAHIGAVMLLLIVALVLAGTEISSWGQYVIAVCVLVPMALASLMCLKHFDPALATPFAPYGWSSVATVMPTIMFTLFGFESIASLYSVVEDPQRNVPRAAVFSVLIVVGMYTLFVASALLSIAPAFFAKGMDQSIADVMVTVWPQYGYMRIITTIGAFFGIFGTLHSMVWSVAMLFRDTITRSRSSMVATLERSNWLSGRNCVLIVGGLTLLFALTLQARIILKLTAVCILPAYILSLVALLFERKEWAGGRNMLTLVAVAASSALLYIAAYNVVS